MKNRINKHIKNQDFVKVYICDKDGSDITHCSGFILDQNDKLILMTDTTDFNYDGLVVLRKKDVDCIKHSDNERFYKKIMDKEGLTKKIKKRVKSLGFRLGSFKEMFEQVRNINLPIIIECKYGNDDIFQIGPINKVGDKKVLVDYINVKGEYDMKPVNSKFKNITFFTVDSPYANNFFKYANRID